MKYILLVGFNFLLTAISFAQSTFPLFLHGTWKMENKELYEHWDSIGLYHLKGFAYALKSGQMQVSEYVEITLKKQKAIYSATALHQNDGKTIEFEQLKTDSALVFENLDHDFPKQIIYKRISDTEMHVRVSDGKQREYAYTMHKQVDGNRTKDTINKNPNYDSALALKLKADDYGMKGYILVMLKTGTHQTMDKALINQHFRGHLENITRLVNEGKLIVAGPLQKNDKNYRGIFILQNISTLDDAKKNIANRSCNQGRFAGYGTVQLVWFGCIS